MYLINANGTTDGQVKGLKDTTTDNSSALTAP
jgi:hypothetical protein